MDRWGGRRLHGWREIEKISGRMKRWKVDGMKRNQWVDRRMQGWRD